MANAFLNSYAPPKKTTPGVMSSLLPKPAQNMTVAPKPAPKPNMSVAPPPTIKQQANANPNTQNKFLNNYGTSNQFLQNYMGVPAKAPEQNVAKPVMSIPTAQAKTVPTQPSGGTSQAPAPQSTAIKTTDNSGGTQNPNYTLQVGENNASAPQGTPAATTLAQDTASPYTVNSGLYGQLITAMANRSTQPGDQYTDAYKQAQLYNQQIQQSKTNQANAEAANRLNPIPVGDQTGREAVMRNQYLAQQNALAGQFTGATNLIAGANTQQGLLQQILQQAAAGAAPHTMAGGQYQMSPLGGGAADAGTGMQKGIQSATLWGSAENNIGLQNRYAQEATDISGKLQNMKLIEQAIIPYMSANKLNSQGIPFANLQINKINSQTDPDAFGTMQAAIGEAQGLAQQVISSGGSVTPTRAGEIVSAWGANMQNMTPPQLAAFLENLDVLGQYRLAVAQANRQAATDANMTGGGNPMQGMDANTSKQLRDAADVALNNMPDWAKGTLGVAGVAGQAVQGAVGNAVAGATGGMAAKVLGI